LRVDDGNQVIDVIDDQFQQSQITTKRPFFFVFHRVAAFNHLELKQSLSTFSVHKAAKISVAAAEFC
jgi:hypothetical protein